MVADVDVILFYHVLACSYLANFFRNFMSNSYWIGAAIFGDLNLCC